MRYDHKTTCNVFLTKKLSFGQQYSSHNDVATFISLFEKFKMEMKSFEKCFYLFFKVPYESGYIVVKWMLLAKGPFFCQEYVTICFMVISQAEKILEQKLFKNFCFLLSGCSLAAAWLQPESPKTTKISKLNLEWTNHSKRMWVNVWQRKCNSEQI